LFMCSDIWSLGIIIYEMCNLRLPFEAQHYNALAIKILKGSFPSITPTYSKQLRDLIISILSPKLQNRPTIIDILNKPFIRPRVEKYISDMLLRKNSQDMEDVYLDTLKEQAHLLGI
jgi:serine/threonine protein kinase